MAFDSVTEFLTMGTHGAYVWSAYGISFVALLLLSWNTISERQKVKKTLQKRLLRESKR